MNKTSLKKCSKHLYLVVLLVSIFIIGLTSAIYFLDVFGTTNKKDLWQSISIDLIKDVKLGFNTEQVIRIAKEHGFSEKQMHKKDSEIRIYTPIEFGASNWVIRLGFSDDKLIYTKVRLEDNIESEYLPKGAPEDIF